MTTKVKKLNALPVRTWRWLGVNGETVDLTDAPDAPYTGECLTGTLPKGVTRYDIIHDNIGFMDDEPEPTLHPELLQFMREKHNSGQFLLIGRGVKAAEPIVFNYELDETNPSVIDDNLFVAEEDSDVTVVLRYTSGESVNAFHCGQTKLIAKRGAHLKLVQVQTLSDRSTHFDAVGAMAMDDASIEVIQAEMGGAKTFANCNTRLLGVKSTFDMRIIYLGDGVRNTDLSVVADHFGKKTKSEITARGALLGQSRKIFRGTIDFKKGSSGSFGREEENTLLFSPRVRNRTAPLILCAEEDVDGRHAASVGRMDENRLFYLMTRGLSELDAKKLTIEAEFAPIVAAIPVPEYRREISDFLQRRLSSVEKL